MDWAQPFFKCCGSKDTTYKAHTGNGTCPDNTPDTCHPDSNCNKTKYDKSCEAGFIDFVKDNLVVIGAVALAVAFIQVCDI